MRIDIGRPTNESKFPRALRALAVMAAMIAIPAACGDDPIIIEDEPNTQRVVLTIGSGTGVQTVTWNVENGSVTPSSVTIPAGQSRAVTAQFLRSDGSADPVINASDFRLDFTRTSGTAVTVAKTDNLTATFTAAAGTAGQSITLTLSVEHLEEGHNEYGPSNALTVSVQ